MGGSNPNKIFTKQVYIKNYVACAMRQWFRTHFKSGMWMNMSIIKIIFKATAKKCEYSKFSKGAKNGIARLLTLSVSSGFCRSKWSTWALILSHLRFALDVLETCICGWFPLLVFVANKQKDQRSPSTQMYRMCCCAFPKKLGNLMSTFGFLV